jgi:hypothetical protein
LRRERPDVTLAVGERGDDAPLEAGERGKGVLGRSAFGLAAAESSGVERVGDA